MRPQFGEVTVAVPVASFPWTGRSGGRWRPRAAGEHPAREEAPGPGGGDPGASTRSPTQGCAGTSRLLVVDDLVDLKGELGVDFDELPPAATGAVDHQAVVLPDDVPVSRLDELARFAGDGAAPAPERTLPVGITSVRHLAPM